MTRIKRKPHRRRSEWGSQHRTQLLTGFDFFGDAFGREDRGTLDINRVREAWAELGDELLAEHIREHPGTRPWAWWLLDAPETMKRTGTMRFKRGVGPRSPKRFDPAYREFVAERDFPHDERVVYWERLLPGAEKAAIDRFDLAYAVYETERQFLGRLGLLEPGEG